MRDRVQPAMFRALGRAIVAVILAGPVLMLGPRLLGAQPLFRTIDSLEVTVANADLVFVGHIESISPPEGTAGYVGVAVSVETTIKGDRGEKWGIDLALPRSLVAGWQTRASRLLVATGSDARAATAVDLSSSTLCVYTENFTCLRTAASVIQTATDLVQRMPAGVKRINTARLKFPPGTLDGGSGYDYATTHLQVPVNDQLEKRARAILRGEIKVDRSDAVEALRFFKSEVNIGLMKSLLTDASKAMNTVAEQNGGVQVEFYSIRERAYDVLTGWGIEVPEPILREVTVHPDRVTSTSRSNNSVSLSNMRGLVTDTTVRELARLPKLTRLDLHNDRLSDAAWESLATLRTLHGLDLAGTNVTDATLAKLGSLPHLEELDLRRTSITSTGLATLGRFSTLKRLRLLGTPGNAAAIAALQQHRPDLVIEIR